MQDCFRKYPEIYGSELQDDEEGAEPAEPAGAATTGDVSEEKPANGAPTKAQIADKLAENKAGTGPETQTKSGAPTSTPPADFKDDVVQAEPAEDKPKTEKKKKAKKARKTEKAESVPTAASDATDATAASAAPAAPAQPESVAAPAGEGVPKAAFDATSANQ